MASAGASPDLSESGWIRAGEARAGGRRRRLGGQGASWAVEVQDLAARGLGGGVGRHAGRVRRVGVADFDGCGGGIR